MIAGLLPVSVCGINVIKKRPKLMNGCARQDKDKSDLNDEARQVLFSAVSSPSSGVSTSRG